MRAQPARSLVNLEESHGCSQSPLHCLTPRRQGGQASGIFFQSLSQIPQSTLHFTQQLGWFGAFSTGPLTILCQAPLQWRAGFGACRADHPTPPELQLWGAPMFYEKEPCYASVQLRFRCRLTSGWGGVETKDKTELLVSGSWVCLNYRGFYFVVCRIHLLGTKKRKQWNTAEENMRIFFLGSHWSFKAYLHGLRNSEHCRMCSENIRVQTACLCGSVLEHRWQNDQLGIGERFQPHVNWTGKEFQFVLPPSQTNSVPSPKPFPEKEYWKPQKVLKSISVLHVLVTFHCIRSIWAA